MLDGKLKLLSNTKMVNQAFASLGECISEPIFFMRVTLLDLTCKGMVDIGDHQITKLLEII